MKGIFLATLIAVAGVVTHHHLADAAQANPLVVLFNGKDLVDWRKPTADWKVVPNVTLNRTNNQAFAVASTGDGVMLNHPSAKSVNLLSNYEHGDVRAHVEFCIPKGSNSGVYFMGRYEIQIFDSFGVLPPKSSDCGGIYERWKDGKGYEGHPPGSNASKPAGEWQTLDVIFKAPRFDGNGVKNSNAKFVKVILNGVTIHENVELSGPTRSAAYENAPEKPTGPLMLQGDHGPVAFRNIMMRPATIE